MKAADRDLDSRREQGTRDVYRARKLVGLNPYQAYQAAVSVALETADYPPSRNDRCGLVVRLDFDFDLVTEDVAIARVKSQTVKARKRVGGNKTAPPLDDVTVVIVMRWLDQFEQESNAVVFPKNV